MILCDAGPLIALIDRGDKNHKSCVTALAQISLPMLATWPCLVEAMYLLGQYGGYTDQEKLWGLMDSAAMKVHHSSDEEQKRMRELMGKYRDLPMDIADASLVVAAETLGISRIFTTDSDFYIYLIDDKQPFEVIP